MKNESLKKLRNDFNCRELEILDNVFPVPVGKICTLLGIRDDFVAMDSNISGKIYKDAKGYNIVANKFHSPSRRRFTYAHELGHYCIHRSIIDSCGGILERSYKQYDKSEMEREQEANNFAAELLMPEIYFLDKYKELTSKYQKTKEILDNLSRFFLVSEEAIYRRLISFGLAYDI